MHSTTTTTTLLVLVLAALTRATPQGPFLGHGPVISCAGTANSGQRCGSFGQNSWVQTCPENKVQYCGPTSFCKENPRSGRAKCLPRFTGHGPVITCAGTREVGKRCGSFAWNHWVQSCPQNKITFCEVDEVCREVGDGDVRCVSEDKPAVEPKIPIFTGHGPVITCAGQAAGTRCGSFVDNHWVQTCPENKIDRCAPSFVCHEFRGLNDLPTAACFSPEDANKLDDPFLPFQGIGPVIPPTLL
jgi:hypothetical protein